MSIDHEPNIERGSIETRGGFVSNMPASTRRKRKIMRTLAFSNWDEKPNVIDLCDDEVENNGQ
ncbi:hypothetical protein JHK82_035602 [Glycine max]|nr:hypothetical protein JHK85_036327 [Glycine max]KAG5112333.1 hypothetical protein JHK82_035602 [Glycine max]KAG5129612.1 hypothetical protein JHK84_036009 [Glycine max]